MATEATRGHFKHNLLLPRRDLLIITYLTCAAEISCLCLDWGPLSSKPVHLRPFTKQAIKKRNGRCFSLCCSAPTRSWGKISTCNNYRTVGETGRRRGTGGYSQAAKCLHSQVRNKYQLEVADFAYPSQALLASQGIVVLHARNMRRGKKRFKEAELLIEPTGIGEYNPPPPSLQFVSPKSV